MVAGHSVLFLLVCIATGSESSDWVGSLFWAWIGIRMDHKWKEGASLGEKEAAAGWLI